MRWIRVLSKNIIHVAMCLQSFVEELLRIRARKPIKKCVEGEREKGDVVRERGGVKEGEEVE